MLQGHALNLSKLHISARDFKKLQMFFFIKKHTHNFLKFEKVTYVSSDV